MSFRDIVKAKFNLSKLVKATEVSDDLVNDIFNNGLIAGSTKSKILRTDGNLSKATELYQVISTAWTDADILRFPATLREFGNIVAAELLENLCGLDTFDSGAPNPNHIPKVLEKDNNPPPFPPSDLEVYEMSGKKVVLIVNVEKNRELGARKDTEKLIKVFGKGGLGFQVILCTDLSKDGIRTAISDLKKRAATEKLSCIFVVVASHGDTYNETRLYRKISKKFFGLVPEPDRFFTAEKNKTLSVKKDLIDQFGEKEEGLHGVPKVFIINICRGENYDFADSSSTSGEGGLKGVCPDEKRQIPVTWEDKNIQEIQEICNIYPESDDDVEMDSRRGIINDTLICYSTYDGCYSFRNSDGTWYLQEFCNEVESKPNQERNFEDILKKVFVRVSASLTTEKSTQCPPFTNHGFFKRLFLRYPA